MQISRKGFIYLLCRHYTASSSSMENIPYMTVVLIVFTSVVYRFNIRVKHWHTAYLGLSPSRARFAIVEHKVGFLKKSWEWKILTWLRLKICIITHYIHYVIFFFAINYNIFYEKHSTIFIVWIFVNIDIGFYLQEYWLYKTIKHPLVPLEKISCWVPALTLVLKKHPVIVNRMSPWRFRGPSQHFSWKARRAFTITTGNNPDWYSKMRIATSSSTN